GSAPLQYQWGSPLNSTANQVSGLDSGLYVVTITHSISQCTVIRYYHINRQYPTLVVSTDLVSNPNCAILPTGAIDLKVTGGNDPYEYLWIGPNGFTATTQDVSNLMPGFYSVTVTDYNDTIKVRTFTLTAQSNLNITNVNETSLYPSGHQVSGFTMCDGEASVAFIPGIGSSNIVWSNGVTGPNTSTLCGGPYSVTITDAVGCSSVWSDALTFPPAITSTTEAVSVSCFGDCNGTAKVSVAGGFAPYSVRWSTGQVDPSVFPSGFSQAVNLCGGEYTVTITDKNLVETITTVVVPEPDEILVTFAATTPRSFNACDGELLITATGAVAPITYVWSGNFGHTGNGERADNLCSGEFVEFYITDNNGCTAYATDSVPYPEDGCFRVSPVITPGQQDGKNDNVHITCVETSIKNHIEIYNRWGQLVFVTDGYTNDDGDREHNWNGLTKSGAPLAEGVYYYVLTYTYIDDQGQEHEEVRKGAINLLQ
ncbi:MAG: gliding motility-associated C-terminal domain-containing protein, partial [Saprospiraceae bacterium]